MRKKFNDLDLNRSVGNLLRLGVILSLAMTALGLIMLFAEGFSMPNNYSDLNKNTDRILQDFWNGLIDLHATSIILLGILILIFTPLMRIIFALVGYIKEKDHTYTIISLIVLFIMLISFMMGFTH
ncbi:MAG: DUF1634 domain-containing protein [Bacteroidetes bacterium]|nr:DUF1634 domain-containing protein [Bacteroidota bacterium]